MDLGRVIHVRVDSALENVLEMLRLGMLAIGEAGEVDVEERRTGMFSFDHRHDLYSVSQPSCAVEEITHMCPR